MKYRMLIADLDGTVLNSRDEPTGRTLDALRRCHAAGCGVVLATGRCYRTALPVVRRIGLCDPVICNNGALVKSPADDRTVDVAAIAPDAVRRAVELIHGEGEAACLHVDGYLRGLDFALVPGPADGPQLSRFLSYFPGTYRTIDLRSADEALEQCLAISVVASDDGLQRCRRAVDAALDSQVRTLVIAAPNFGLRLFEIFAPGVGKWSAAYRLARRQGIRRHEILAIGDDVNDLEMLREAGLGIAMGNAAEPVRRVADRIAPTCDEDGLAAVLEELLEPPPASPPREDR